MVWSCHQYYALGKTCIPIHAYQYQRKIANFATTVLRERKGFRKERKRERERERKRERDFKNSLIDACFLKQKLKTHSWVWNSSLKLVLETYDMANFFFFPKRFHIFYLFQKHVIKRWTTWNCHCRFTCSKCMPCTIICVRARTHARKHLLKYSLRYLWRSCG